jgi:hypothetical protein
MSIGWDERHGRWLRRPTTCYAFSRVIVTQIGRTRRA